MKKALLFAALSLACFSRAEPSAGYPFTWSDEFDGTTLDTSGFIGWMAIGAASSWRKMSPFKMDCCAFKK
jgi:hypothetical protein